MLVLPDAVRELAKVAAALLRDHENRIAALERRSRGADADVL